MAMQQTLCWPEIWPKCQIETAQIAILWAQNNGPRIGPTFGPRILKSVELPPPRAARERPREVRQIRPPANDAATALSDAGFMSALLIAICKLFLSNRTNTMVQLS